MPHNNTSTFSNVSSFSECPISMQKLSFRGKGSFLRSLWKNPFLLISPKISKFKEEAHYLMSLLYYRISYICSKNLRKTTLFRDHFEKGVFCPYIRKYQHFEEMGVKIWKMWEIIRPYVQNNQHFQENYFILSSVGKSRFWQYIWKYQHFQKRPFLWYHLKKRFVSILPKISTLNFMRSF